jgi:hypothetical protein
MESVGPRQKRRRVEAALKDIELSIEAESSFTGVRTEEYDLLPETTVNEEIADEPTDGDTQEDLTTNQLVTDGAGAFQCRMDFSETLTVIDEFDYESDAEPLDSSCDECEISSDDDFDDDSIFQNLLIDDLQSNDCDSGVGDPLPYTFKTKLASWAVDFKIKQNDVDSLLSDVLPALPEYEELDLPKTCRTLLNTLKKTALKCVEPGHYFHFGLSRGIRFMLQKYGFFFFLMFCPKCFASFTTPMDLQ